MYVYHLKTGDDDNDNDDDSDVDGIIIIMHLKKTKSHTTD